MREKVDNKLLELRNANKSKKPVFLRQQGKYINSLGKKWRAPKGMHSKLRRKLRGKPRHPSVGYSSPSDIRGLHRTGLIPVLVHNAMQLERLDARYGVIIGSVVGQKKKVEILKKIKEMKLTSLNVKDIDQYIANVEEKLKKRAGQKKTKVKEKTKEEKKAPTKEVPQEEKEKHEKEEKRKILESRR